MHTHPLRIGLLAIAGLVAVMVSVLILVLILVLASVMAASGLHTCLGAGLGASRDRPLNPHSVDSKMPAVAGRGARGATIGQTLTPRHWRL